MMETPISLPHKVININRSREEVFDYVTTPKTWPIWNPLTIKIAGHIEKSLDSGEECRETMRTPFLWDRIWLQAVIDWTVVEKDRPQKFIIEGTGPSRRKVTYLFEDVDIPVDGKKQMGTRWTRELTYTPRNWFLGILNKIWFEKRLRKESKKALKNVKSKLEEEAPSQEFQ